MGSGFVQVNPADCKKAAKIPWFFARDEGCQFILETMTVPVRQRIEDSRNWSQKTNLVTGIERAVGAVFLTMASPAIAVSSAAIFLLSGQSPFIAHLRVGEGGRPFWMWKLRTMWSSRASLPERKLWVEYIVADPTGQQKDPQDHRITSGFARFIRRHSIDELPQLWHVARGEMALVGPRPVTKSELNRYYGSRAAVVLSVKPGMTGQWQTHGRNAIKFPERAEMDLEMVRNLTPRTYLSILLRTLPALFHGKGAW